MMVKLQLENASLRIELQKQSLRVANAQQATADVAARWAYKAPADVVSDPFTAATDVEAVNQWARRPRELVDDFVRHLINSISVEPARNGVFRVHLRRRCRSFRL